MIPIRRSAMTKVKTLECQPCSPISKKMICTTGSRSFIWTRQAVIRQYELQGFHYKGKGAVPIQSLPALHFRSGPSHHHCSNPKRQPSTYHAGLTVYRRFCFPRPEETRMFLNQRPVEITTFRNTKGLLPR
jgi:hypothetical protein